jgi:hypothetical protein
VANVHPGASRESRGPEKPGQDTDPKKPVNTRAWAT